MLRNASICIHGAGAWARLEKDSGAPISVEMISAMSPSLPAYRLEKFWTTSIRSSGDIRGHGPESNARRAAATAASMSALLPSGTVATTCSECGETTWIVSPVAGVAHSPSMKRVLWSRLMANLLRFRRLGSEGEEVSEARGIVAADHAVLEEPETLRAVAGRAPDVVDHAEHEPALHGLVGQVVGESLGERLALPGAVGPVRVAAVPASDMEGYGEPR